MNVRQITQTGNNINCPEYATLVPFPLGSQEFCAAELSAGLGQKEKSFQKDGGLHLSSWHISLPPSNAAGKGAEFSAAPGSALSFCSLFAKPKVGIFRPDGDKGGPWTLGVPES